MKAVLDAVSSLEGASTPRTTRGTKSTSGTAVKRVGRRGEIKAKAKEREDDVLPRKQRELNEQTRCRLMAEGEEKEEGKKEGKKTSRKRRTVR